MSHLNSANFWQSIKKDRLLLVILLIGLLLRGLNSTFGSPSLYVSNDEAIAHLSAFNMIANKTPISIANYTPLGAYVQIPFLVTSFLFMKILGLVSNASDFELFVLTHEGYFLFIPRLISAFFGTLTILVVYKISMHLFKLKEVALISAFLAAVSFNFVHISHFGRPWTAALFFFILAVYFLIKNRAFYSYLTVALSYGFHQVGILAIPLVIWLTKKRLTFKNLINIVALALMLLIFGSLTLRTGLIESIRKDQSFLKVGKLAADILAGNPDLIGSVMRSIKENLLLFFTVNFLVTDGIIFLFAIWGMIKSFKQDLQKKLVYYILGYFTFAALFFHPLPRYLLPIFLISIPFAAYSLMNILKRSKFLFITLLVVSSFNSLWWNMLFLRTPTFIQAHDWVNQNVPVSVPIVYLGGRYQTFVPNRDAILTAQQKNANYYGRLLLALSNNDSDNGRKIIYASIYPGKDKFEQFNIARGDCSEFYVIDYYNFYSDRLYYAKPEFFDLKAHFTPLMTQKLINVPEPLFDPSYGFRVGYKYSESSMYDFFRMGPFVDVLKIKECW